MIIGLYIRADLQTESLCKEIKSLCEKNDCKIFLEAESKVDVVFDKLEISELVKKVDLIISLGGDGTLLRIANYAIPNDLPVLGVNFGKLGFLTEIAPNQLIDVLKSYLENNKNLTKRSLINCKIDDLSQTAINDIVIEKGLKASLLTFQIKIDDSELMSLRADGLIFATPTGSTAYSLAAGGSIVHHGVEVILITPICAHSLNVRPVIVPANSKITVEAFDSIPPLVFVDGRFCKELMINQKLEVSNSNKYLRLVSSNNDYFDILRTKLNWGLGYGGS